MFVLTPLLLRSSYYFTRHLPAADPAPKGQRNPISRLRTKHLNCRRLHRPQKSILGSIRSRTRSRTPRPSYLRRSSIRKWW